MESETEIVVYPNQTTIGLVNTFITEAPSAFIKYGIVLIVIIFIGLFYLISILKYPDKINASAIIVNEIAPVELHAEKFGRIEEIYFHDKSLVKKGEIILSYESTEDLAGMLELNELIEQINVSDLIDMSSKFKFPEFWNLGVIGDLYTSLVSRYSTYINLKLAYNPKREVSFLDKELSSERIKINEIEDEIETIQAERLLYEKDLERSRQLNEWGSTSDKDFESILKEGYSYDRLVNSMNMQLVSLRSGISNIEKQKLLLRNSYSKNLDDSKAGIINSFVRLKSAIDIWRKDNLLLSPIDGVLQYSNYHQKNNLVQPGGKLFDVVPKEQSNKFNLRISVAGESVADFGVGSKVMCYLADYNHLKYGFITTEISEVSIINSRSDDKSYLFNVVCQLTKAPVTNKGNEITLKSNMLGNVSILTSEYSILERLLFQFRDIIGDLELK